MKLCVRCMMNLRFETLKYCERCRNKVLREISKYLTEVPKEGYRRPRSAREDTHETKFGPEVWETP